MKKTQKRAFGLLGLLLVFVITIFAATIPEPKASATSSMTDTITVRVVSGNPYVEITSPANGSVFVSPSHDFTFVYSAIDTGVIKLEYTDADGNPQEDILKNIVAIDHDTGHTVVNLDLSDPKYGYGDYVMTIIGNSSSALSDEFSISFSYYPVTASLDEDRGDDDAGLNLNYDDNNTEIEKFEITVYDKNGNEVVKIPVITATPPTTKVKIPFDENNLPAGTYSIAVRTYGADGILCEPYWLTYVYEPTRIPVPNTGGVLKGLNVSKSDYLITGLIIFFLVGVSGIFFIAKSNKKSKRRR